MGYAQTAVVGIVLLTVRCTPNFLEGLGRQSFDRKIDLFSVSMSRKEKRLANHHAQYIAFIAKVSNSDIKIEPFVTLLYDFDDQDASGT